MLFKLRFPFVLLLLLLSLASCQPMRRAARDVPPGFYQEYSQRLGISLSGRENPLLIAEAASWMGVPHRMGGMTRSGVDCSGLVWNVYRNVYNIDLPRSSAAMASESRRIRRKARLREGDLVFFRTKRRQISHVGIYLGQSKFIHASTSRGVIVSDLDESWYQRNWAFGGRP